MLLVVVVSRYVFGEEAAETLLVGVESLNALAGKTSDAAGGRTGAALVNLQVASLLQRLDLDAQVAARGAGDLTEVHKTGALETVEGDHDFQPQLVVEQWIDNGKLKWTHIS